MIRKKSTTMSSSKKRKNLPSFQKKVDIETFKTWCAATKNELLTNEKFRNDVLIKKQNMYTEGSFLRKMYTIAISAKLCTERENLDGCTLLYRLIHNGDVRITQERSRELYPYRQCLYKVVSDTIREIITKKNEQQPPQPVLTTAQVIPMKKNGAGAHQAKFRF